MVIRPLIDTVSHGLAPPSTPRSCPFPDEGQLPTLALDMIWPDAGDGVSGEVVRWLTGERGELEPLGKMENEQVTETGRRRKTQYAMYRSMFRFGCSAPCRRPLSSDTASRCEVPVVRGDRDRIEPHRGDGQPGTRLCAHRRTEI